MPSNPIDRESWPDSWKPASSAVVAEMVGMYEDVMGRSCPEVPQAYKNS
ncbi:MAG: hypothetical protein HOK21_04915 [Rhodospirillaceae bacterium]|jgi:hypothetical protein|nr:hypothetical protein [Rhodospirillaceae bacterium]MBT5523405.1 hypothetical protein [Rhodospirillaceae bacterium]MBT6588425.1 hypothetical protein [Rhodospirillaceae bacterium]MBT7288058.1 hypothetical protein [Rhodospirillaceae bacterium]MBT7665103.1 hypothetical protein [Rhodospirillaceae bacterium]